MHSTWTRISLALTFLIAANVLAGVAAVHLGYPSLWGNSKVFLEYALPLPFGWGLAHWLSMTPLAFLIFHLPNWDERRLVRARWVLSVLLLMLIATALVWSGWRWRKVPFVLFPLVDGALALVVSLTFKPPLRLLAGLAVAAGIGAASVIVFSNRAPQSHPSTPPEGETTRSESLAHNALTASDRKGPLLKLLEPEASRPNIVRIEVLQAVAEGEEPSPLRICSQARPLFEKFAWRHRLDLAVTRVKFQVHPDFDSRWQYVYPGGEAYFDENASWICRFEYPDPASRPG